MVDGKMLTERTKEELIKIILDQDARIRELKEKVQTEQKKRNERFTKSDTTKKRKKRPGPGFDGTLISDFFSVYLKLPYRMQKRLVHLLWEFHGWVKTDRTTECVRAYRKNKRLINDAIRLHARYGQIPTGNTRDCG